MSIHITNLIKQKCFKKLYIIISLEQTNPRTYLFIFTSLSINIYNVSNLINPFVFSFYFLV
jgi:hypothetical protein